MSNISRKLQKQDAAVRKWALKVQRKDALVFSALNGGRTLSSMLQSNSQQPLMGLVRLPPDCGDALIESGNVWVDGVVCKDPDRVLQAGSFIAVFPSSQMYLFEDNEGRRALRLKA